jgi:hypothetical protein
MTNSESEDGFTRDDLVRRIELMEAMIAEGRQTTMSKGWIFILWGVVDLAGMGLQRLQPHSERVWPIVLTVGLALQLAGIAVQKRGSRRSRRTVQCHDIQAVWVLMGVALVIYTGTALATHFAWQYSYLSGLLMIIGLAHAISAALLHWRVQGVVAAIWWVGAAAILVCNSYRATQLIFLVEMCLGMIAFGAYVMLLERRDRDGAGANA